ncbi:hypothetical protein PybrP1_003664 [[Pythium] brassicae (nom. inval.)]|nr:hypothetical protein PybrP1_003664 [[Pythium] brassicae (nom. inval.)]
MTVAQKEVLHSHHKLNTDLNPSELARWAQVSFSLPAAPCQMTMHRVMTTTASDTSVLRSDTKTRRHVSSELLEKRWPSGCTGKHSDPYNAQIIPNPSSTNLRLVAQTQERNEVAQDGARLLALASLSPPPLAAAGRCRCTAAVWCTARLPLQLQRRHSLYAPRALLALVPSVRRGRLSGALHTCADYLCDRRCGANSFRIVSRWWANCLLAAPMAPRTRRPSGCIRASRYATIRMRSCSPMSVLPAVLVTITSLQAIRPSGFDLPSSINNALTYQTSFLNGV